MPRDNGINRSWTNKKGEHFSKKVEKRTAKSRREFEVEKNNLVNIYGHKLPFYESRRLGGTAELPPEGFRDDHKSVAEWRDAFRKLKPGAKPRAFVASWWQPMPNNLARWVEVYHIDDTVFIKGRSAANIRARLHAGEALTTKEKAKLLESDLGM